GTAPSRYSVSPTFLRQTTGGKPMEKASTRIPKRRAKRKCPSSWMKTRMPRARATQKTYERMSRTASMQRGAGVSEARSTDGGPRIVYAQTTRLRFGRRTIHRKGTGGARLGSAHDGEEPGRLVPVGLQHNGVRPRRQTVCVER